jgi:hypothetical protein
MNVSELIELTNLLSIDNEDLTQRERDAYLVYLNLANNDLYQVAAGGLRTVIKKTDIFYDSANNWFSLPADLFTIRSVCGNSRNNYIITSVDVNAGFNIPADKYLVMGNNLYINNTYNLSSYAVKTDPSDNTDKNYIELYYAPNPLRLVEVVNDPLAEINIPVYPLPFHHFLAKRALYYFYFSNKIFLDKMAYLLNDWNNDKAQMAQFKNYGL